MKRDSREDRILLLTATGKDAQLAVELLARAGLVGYPCRDLPDMLHEMTAGAAALLLAQEAIELADVATLRAAMLSQPPWSDLPIVLVAAPGDAYERSHWIVERLRPTCNLTLLERPLQKLTLLTAMQVALRSRRRQYEVRDLLKKLEASRLELHDKIVDLQKFEEVVVGRELRMIALEKEVADLKRELERAGSDHRGAAGGRGETLVTPS